MVGESKSRNRRVIVGVSVIAQKLCYRSYAKIRAHFWIGDVRCGSIGSPAGGPTGGPTG